MLLSLQMLLLAAISVAAAAAAPVGPASCGGGPGLPTEEPEEDVSLLQVHLESAAKSSHSELAVWGTPEEPPLVNNLISRINAAPTAEERLQLLKPLLWVHISKTGTGIITLLESHPGICPLAPDSAKEPIEGIDDEAYYDMYPRSEYCPGSFNLSYSGFGHLGFGPYYDGNQGHAIAMFRQPEQRLMSAYYWSASLNFTNTPELANSTVQEYAEALQGCQVKMLTVMDYPDGPSPCVMDYSPPSEREVNEALIRLRNGFAFVGLTDEWDLSMCLFHAKFGGECQAAEFTNSRPGEMSSDSGYDTSALNGFTDQSDNKLFSLAKTIFEEDLETFGVSHESCQSWCYSKATATK